MSETAKGLGRPPARFRTSGNRGDDVPDGALRDGGDVVPAEAERPVGSKAVEDVHRGNIAKWLIVLLAVVVIGHYLCVMVMEWNGKKTDATSAAFNAALPVISGLVGSAVTYYFTRGRN